MEDFEKLLEDYLNFESYEEIDGDYEEVINPKSAKTESPFTNDDAISIDRFVRAFLGYQFDCSKLYHCGLRELKLDFVIGIDNNFANKNIEYVKKGFLLIVKDAKGRRGTYINPVYIKRYLEKEDIEKVYSTFHKIQQIEFEKLNEYYSKYLDTLMQYEEMEKFKILLFETHKMNKIRRLERRKKND